ncbi:MAG: FAD:protein FMN transferase [Burkholderiaceae bacterium]
MRRRQILHAAMGAGMAGTVAAQPAPLLWRRRDWLGFGTTLSLRAGGDDAGRLDEALDAAVRAVRAIEAQMSLYDPDSALSRLNRHGRLDAPPPDLLAVLRLSQWVSRHSGGAFDATVQPLWLAFEAARLESRLPRAAEVAAARAQVDWRGVQVDAGHVAFARPGMAITLNGVAQGHASDRVRDVLRAHGVRHALIDTGELSPLGHNPDDGPWRLGVVDPRHEQQMLARVLADGRCIATSADEPSSFSPDHRHHHIFDPASGYSPPGLASVTVAARSGALADALTKVMFVAGPQQVEALARRWQVDVLWMDKLGRRGATPGWRLTAG